MFAKASRTLTESTSSTFSIQPRQSLGQPAPEYANGGFNYPYAFGQNFTIGSNINVTWTITNSSWSGGADLSVSQISNDTASSKIIAFATIQEWYEWPVGSMLELGNLTAPFHFHLTTTVNNEATGFWSAGFYLKNPDPVSPSVSSNSRNSAATATAGALAQGSALPIPSSQASSSAGLSSSAKAGIGVGVTIGALILITLIAGFVWLGKRTKRPQGTETEKSPLQGQGGGEPLQHDFKYAPDALGVLHHPPPVEADNTAMMPVEADDTTKRLAEADDTAKAPAQMQPQELPVTEHYGPK